MRFINACLPLLMSMGLGAATVRADVSLPSVAFYYGAELPAAALAHFDQVVVQADQVPAAAIDQLRRRGAAVFAYVSLSEMTRPRVAALGPAQRQVEGYSLGGNPEWNTLILNAADAGWQRFLIEREFQPLWDRGFRAFFLDNLDSYQRIAKTPAERAAQVQGLVQIIRQLHARFPGIKLLFNRGFELLPEVAQLAVGLAAESLFRGWDPAKKRFVEVSEPDRAWLLGQLRTARDRYHLPITVIDYVPPAQRELMRATARRIGALGLTPFVSDPALTSVGMGSVEVIPRRILALYDGAEQRDRGPYADVAYTPVHMMAAVALEYLGYAVDYVDVRAGLPSGLLTDRYAGIVTWFTDDQLSDPVAYRAWLLKQLDAGLRVAVLDHFGFTPDRTMLQRLGLVREETKPAVGEVQLVHADPELTGFEAKVAARQNTFHLQELRDPAGKRLLSVADRSGARMDAVFTASWGGLASSPYLLAEGPEHHYRWIIDPFAFFKEALRLPELPAPDVTTQDGRRMLIVHIDGDGFPTRAEMPGNEYAGKVVLDRILRRYPVKATVSVIEGEVGPEGKWPKLSPELEPIARAIFALPNVEIASHSYSHPFDWQRFGQDQEDGDINGLFRYAATLQREIDDSIGYIARRLAPKGKPVKVFLWSGEAIAPREALQQAQAAGLWNMNGGNTIMSRRNPTLTTAAPMGRPVGPYYQVYAPVQNENVFTNLWRGPYYGFRDVISTFQLTDSPRRLKPINIYFHFYSGSKIASLKALQQVFGWALAQDPVSVFASEYIRKVEDFQRLTLAQTQNGCWQLRGDGALTTLRLDRKLGQVDTTRSRGVVGVHELPQGRFVSLDSSGRALLCTTAGRNASLGTPAAAAAAVARSSLTNESLRTAARGGVHNARLR